MLVDWKKSLLWALALTVVLSTTAAMAKKGGNGGGGGGGGEDPPTVNLPDVRYISTRVIMPDSGYYFNDKNESGAVVGWTSGVGGKRAFAYLPGKDAFAAYDLNDLVAGVEQGVPPGWYLASATGINNHGDIVGYLQQAVPDPAEKIRIPYFLDMHVTPPQVTVLSSVDPAAVYEHASDINDSGDITLGTWTPSTEGTSSSSDAYVGHPRLGDPDLYHHETEPVVGFAKIHIDASAAMPSGPIHLSNRLGELPAIVSGLLRYNESDERTIFRMATDGSWFELAPISYDAQGNLIEFRTCDDLNDLGDVTGHGLKIYPRKIKGRTSERTPVIWRGGSGQQGEAVDDIDGPPASTNNNGDLCGSDALWHAEWSETNGPLNIADMLHPQDALVWQSTNSVQELTDRDYTNGASGFPVIIAYGIEVIDGVEMRFPLILTPVDYTPPTEP